MNNILKGEINIFMKILIVIDQFDNSNNGTTVSARRFVKGLQDAGNEVYVISTGDKKDEYSRNHGYQYVFLHETLPVQDSCSV